MLISLVATLCGLAVFMILFLLKKYLARYHINLFHALRYYTEKQPPPQTLMDYKFVKGTVAFVKRIASVLPQTSFLSKLDEQLRRAGIPLLGSEFIVVVAFTSVLAGIVIFTITLNPAGAVVATLAVIIAEFILLRRLVSRRREIFINQLCDCLTTISNALRAGFSFMQAMELVSREMEPPISEEFQHVMRDISYGMLMDQALQDMDKRVGVIDFHLVVTAVLIQREIGGNLAQILDSISETINSRIRMRREILTLTTQGRASSWIVSALPAFIAGMMILVDPHHFDELLENQIGLIVLGIAVVMEIVGFIVIRKMVTIKVE